MSTQPRPLSDLLFFLAGPIMWAAHFFAVYLAEAFLCTAAGATVVRLTGIGLTIAALAMLVGVRLRRQDRAEQPAGLSSMARPLIDLSIVAVIWTSIPLFAIHPCAPAGG